MVVLELFSDTPLEADKNGSKDASVALCGSCCAVHAVRFMLCCAVHACASALQLVARLRVPVLPVTLVLAGLSAIYFLLSVAVASLSESDSRPSLEHQASIHVPVLPGEVIRLGEPTPGEYWIDGTAGGGGHSSLIAERICSTINDSGPDSDGQAVGDERLVSRSGNLLAIDRDPEAVARLRKILPPDVLVEQASYEEIPSLIQRHAWPKVHGILLDLGLSSDQLEDEHRGFSFQTTGSLDMRFDPHSGLSVAELLHSADEKTIADVIYQYGEERFSRRIARAIVDERRRSPIESADRLREIIYRAMPGGRRTSSKQRHGRIDPATRTFQALRIWVNDELEILRRTLDEIPDEMALGGRLLVISFHSLEDRIVKHHFRNDPRLEVVTKKPVCASEAEVANNARSRSAKLRVARRIEPQVDDQRDGPLPFANFNAR